MPLRFRILDFDLHSLNTNFRCQETSNNMSSSGSPETNQNLVYNAVPINVNPNVSPSSPIDQQPTIGLIGMGAMGRMYAKALCVAGWKKIHVCDRPERFDEVQKAYIGASPSLLYI
ncbi:hypothetical protein BDN70DRAFT_399213 [Pholiota conissans]|uniref:6-phosphogluconate dehydrogenase NADP-binding domain-containing protein n=1 Tax=Pholiota conissans TaxID=109636 RepID=A0A9P5YNX4_9AGAR|nr:hypothetical protein BDN70DRAFT_399213 [Pholiota conissans]